MSNIKVNPTITFNYADGKKAVIEKTPAAYTVKTVNGTDKSDINMQVSSSIAEDKFLQLLSKDNFDKVSMTSENGSKIVLEKNEEGGYKYGHFTPVGTEKSAGKSGSSLLKGKEAFDSKVDSVDFFA